MNSKTVHECFACGGKLPGQRSLRRHLLAQHRYVASVVSKEIPRSERRRTGPVPVPTTRVAADDALWQEKFDMYYKRTNNDVGGVGDVGIAAAEPDPLIRRPSTVLMSLAITSLDGSTSNPHHKATNRKVPKGNVIESEPIVSPAWNQSPLLIGYEQGSTVHTPQIKLQFRLLATTKRCKRRRANDSGRVTTRGSAPLGEGA